MYYTVIKHSGHLRTLEKCRKHSPAARAFHISVVFSNACRVLSQCNTRLRLLYLLNTSRPLFNSHHHDFKWPLSHCVFCCCCFYNAYLCHFLYIFCNIELLFILKVSPGRRDGICLDRTIFKTLWKNILAIKENWADVVTIRMCDSLVTMTMQSEHRDQFPAKVETPVEERTEVKHG